MRRPKRNGEMPLAEFLVQCPLFFCLTSTVLISPLLYCIYTVLLSVRKPRHPACIALNLASSSPYPPSRTPVRLAVGSRGMPLAGDWGQRPQGLTSPSPYLHIPHVPLPAVPHRVYAVVLPVREPRAPAAVSVPLERIPPKLPRRCRTPLRVNHNFLQIL